ncbi:MAG: hypothetical protein NTX03_00345 [Bacteroidetes bacterium]|nr:hypothetical protein [Bacteroidota bacterium]
MFKALLNIGWQASLNHTAYRKYILKLLKGDGGDLTKTELNRIRKYCIISPTLLGYGFALLRGERITKDERYSLLRISAATPFFDDFFDDSNLSINKLEQVFIKQREFVSQNPKEAIFYNLLYQKPGVEKLEALIPIAQKIFEAQQEAQALVSTKVLSKEIVVDLSLKKGGYSSLLFWKILAKENSIEMVEIAFQAGRIIQFTDDIFDLWFDLQEGIQTLATTAKSIFELERDYINEIKILEDLVINSGIEKKKTDAFMRHQNIFYSLGFAALRQLKRLCKENETFNPANYSRKQLVCDMELWGNRLAWFKYLLKIKS